MLCKIAFEISSNPEKIIAAATLSVVMAILFDGKKKKRGGKKNQLNFPKRVMKNYRIADNLLCKTVAKNTEKKSVSDNKEFHTKLRDLEIEDAIPFDLKV